MNQWEHPFLESNSKELCLHGVLGNETFALLCSLHRCRLLEIKLSCPGWESASLLPSAQASVSVQVRAPWAEQTQTSVALKGLPKRLRMSSFFRYPPCIQCFYINFSLLSSFRTTFIVQKGTPCGAFLQSQGYGYLTVSVFAGLATDLGHQLFENCSCAVFGQEMVLEMVPFVRL